MHLQKTKVYAVAKGASAKHDRSDKFEASRKN